MCNGGRCSACHGVVIQFATHRSNSKTLDQVGTAKLGLFWGAFQIPEQGISAISLDASLDVSKIMRLV